MTVMSQFGLSSVLRTNFELDLKSSVGHVSIAEGSEEDHHLIVLRFDCLSQRLITTEPKQQTVINQSSKIDISTMPTPAYSQAMRLATLATLCQAFRWLCIKCQDEQQHQHHHLDHHQLPPSSSLSSSSTLQSRPTSLTESHLEFVLVFTLDRYR